MDEFVADGSTAIVMELVDGATLADRIAEGPIPPDEAREAARELVIVDNRIEEVRQRTPAQ